MLKKILALPIQRKWSHQSPLVPLVVLQATLKTKQKEASQNLQQTPKHRPRSSPTCFTGQLITLRTESISDQMTKFASTRVYHERFPFTKKFRKFGWVVNGTRLFGSFHWTFSGINGIPEKVVPFSRWKLPNGKFVFHLQIYCPYHQFHAFRGLLSGQASLEWDL